MFDPTIFKTEPWWRTTCVWGSGHTLTSIPTNKGWKFGPIDKRSTVCLLGQKGEKGCAIITTDNGLQIAYHDLHTPKEVVDLFQTGNGIVSYHLDFKDLDDIPGWGLAVIEEIEKRRDLIYR